MGSCFCRCRSKGEREMTTQWANKQAIIEEVQGLLLEVEQEFTSHWKAIAPQANYEVAEVDGVSFGQPTGNSFADRDRMVRRLQEMRRRLASFDFSKEEKV